VDAAAGIRAEPARARLGRTFSWILLAIAAAVLVWRLPAAFHEFDDRAAKNDRGGDRGRVLALADAIDVDNEFVIAALSVLPRDARYAVMLPPSPEIAEKTYGIGPLTVLGLPFYLEYLLLPRRQVPPEQAQFVVCYACDTSAWDKRTTWLWKNDHALVIGKVRGP
jgi:hypothetical protein